MAIVTNRGTSQTETTSKLYQSEYW